MKPLFTAVAAVVVLFGASRASAQIAGETLAAYALDFCAAVVDGQAPATAKAKASPDGSMEGPQPIGDDLKLVGHDLNATAETPIYVLGPSAVNPRIVMAFARADATRCMTFAGDSENSLDVLRRRLTNPDGPWQFWMGWPTVELYRRNASDGRGGLNLALVAANGTNGARVTVERTNETITIFTPEQRAAWASVIVKQCAAGVHQHLRLSAEAFAPFFKRAEKQSGGSLTLENEPGQPGGVLFLNSQNGNVCLLAIAADVPELERALIRAIPKQDNTTKHVGTYLWPKPQGSGGRDAVFAIASSYGPLMMRVFPR